jgi:hypothetical protein
LAPLSILGATVRLELVALLAVAAAVAVPVRARQQPETMALERQPARRQQAVGQAAMEELILLVQAMELPLAIQAVAVAVRIREITPSFAWVVQAARDK